MLRILGSTNFNFIGFRRKAFFISAGLIICGIAFLIARGGIRYGIDFTGGSLIQLHFDKPITTEELRSSLAKIGLGRAIIQRFGTANDFLIRARPGEFIAADSVGPQVLHISIDPNPTAGEKVVSLKATLMDREGSLVTEAEYFLDSLGGPGEGAVLSAVDRFDSPEEEAIGSVPVGEAETGIRRVWVRGKDGEGNWGGAEQATIYVTGVGEKGLPPGIAESVLEEREEREEEEAPTGELGTPGDLIAMTLSSDFPDNPARIDREELVGPAISKGLQLRAMLVVLLGMVVILIYVSFRFSFRFGVGAVVALLHDVLITVGIFSILNKEMTIPIIAALLTILGYSINDSIVVSDRIRENLKLLRREPFPVIVNSSINQTLSRTVITSLTTLLVLIALVALGGEVIRDFALALIIGVIVGTYSSIFILSPIVVEWERMSPTRAKRM